jgi:peptidoglycan hydrolase-like protein with peptidoglycan-binding domain
MAARLSVRPPAVAVAVAVAALVAVAAVLGWSEWSGGNATTTTTTATTTTPATTVAPTTTSPTTTTNPNAPTHLANPLARGSSGTEVERLQERLDQLGFFVGPIDGQFGGLTEAAVWAFEKLVLQTPRSSATGVVTDELWQLMQQPIRVEPRRKHADGAATVNHTEIYLPEQVVAIFVDDRPVLISHMSSGDGQEWREVVTIDPGEYGNENGTEPLVRGEIGYSVTPGGVFEYDRMITGRRQSALGGMYNPAYFNYGIAIHGALNVPLHPASHGCIRLPMKAGEAFQQHIAIGDQVFVWDGVKEPEEYGAQLPVFNRIDHEWAATSTTAPPPPIAPTSTTTSASP